MTESDKKDGAVAKTIGNEALGTNSQISRKLREYYDGLVTDQVPDKFMELLSRLDSEEQTPSRKAEG